MKKLTRLWKTLEEEPILEGVLDQWELWLGADYEIAGHFLYPTGAVAFSYPCSGPLGPECPRRVVVHADDDVVAVCGNTPRRCETIKLRKTDLALCRLNMVKLVADIASAFGARGGVEEGIAGSFKIWAMGDRIHTDGTRLPCYFVLPDVEEGYAGVLARLLAPRAHVPSVIVVPSTRNLNDTAHQLLNSRGVVLLAAEDHCCWHETRGLVIESSLDVLVDGLLGRSSSTAARKEEPPLAIRFSNEFEGHRAVHSVEELEELRASSNQLMHFVDALDGKTVTAKTQCDTREADELTPGEGGMLLAYLLYCENRTGHVRPSRVPLAAVVTAESRRKVFMNMRKKVDVRIGGQKYRLFDQRKPLMDTGESEYLFKPNEKVTYCFLFRPEEYFSLHTDLLS